MKRHLLISLLALACLPTGCKQKKPKADAAASASANASAAPSPAAESDIPAPADVAAAPANATKSQTGLASVVLQPGTSTDKPKSWDRVKVHYTGWTADGKMFDSSIKRNAPATFSLSQVIKGWTEGLQLMSVGEKRRFWIPGELAYGNTAQMGRPSGQLTFDVELLEVTHAPEPPPVPTDVAAAPESAEKSPSGLASVVLQKGTGKDKPRAHDQVKFHFTGWTADGKMFDSSIPRSAPLSMTPGEAMLKGWAEGLQIMVAGEKRRFWIPGTLAYDAQPGDRYPKGQVTFDIEMLEISRMPDPPAVPKDVAKAPADAKKTASGLRYKVLKAGSGKKHPAASDRVKVHYSGWTTDGKMFDSSVARGEATSFGLSQVIKGWTEGLQLMVEGEKARFWIPAELAYGKETPPGAPAGELVFDVELIQIL